MTPGGGILESQGNKAPEYWCSYVLVAFQGPAAPDATWTPPRSDGDPNSELPLRGLYVGQILLYDEDLHDYSVKNSLDLPSYRERVLTHEIGHAFAGTHEDGGIMGDADPADARFTEKTLDRIRDTVFSP